MSKQTFSFFCRLVKLDRLRLATLKENQKKMKRNGGKDPDILVERPSKNMGGVTVSIIKVLRLFYI